MNASRSSSVTAVAFHDGQEAQGANANAEKGLEIPVPKRADWDAMLDKVIKPADGPPEIEDAARDGDPGRRGGRGLAPLAGKPYLGDGCALPRGFPPAARAAQWRVRERFG
jgi:hypothetical protein